jgi:hypothetical protein
VREPPLTIRRRLDASLHTQFMRAWVSQYYREQEEAAHAENDEREKEEVEQLALMGVYRDWARKRVRLKPAAGKRKKPTKKAAARSKEH